MIPDPALVLAEVLLLQHGDQGQHAVNLRGLLASEIMIFILLFGEYLKAVVFSTPTPPPPNILLVSFFPTPKINNKLHNQRYSRVASRCIL